jgi:ATP-dependent exoDNAse (exonuclease V) beta subunit
MPRQSPAVAEKFQGGETRKVYAAQASYENFGSDIGWTSKIKPKFEEAAHVSRQQLYAKRKGDVINYILSLISVLPDHDDSFLDECVRAGTAKYHFQNHSEMIRKIIDAFFRNTDFTRFFTLQENDIVYTEKEIIDERGNAYKVDRMIVHADNTIDIVDFKSGEIQAEEHRDQINRYGRIIGRIYPGSVVRRHLVYIEEDAVVTL